MYWFVKQYDMNYKPMELKDVLKGLMENLGTTVEVLADATGISKRNLSLYLNGTIPSGENLFKLSEYFAIPMDVLYGRITQDEFDSIMRNYPNQMMNLRTFEYKSYIIWRKQEFPFPDYGYESVYPYNFIESVTGSSNELLIADEDVEWMEEILDTACKADKELILMHFKDGLSMNQISQKTGIEPQKIQRRIRKSLNLLRSKKWKDVIIRGRMDFKDLLLANERLVEKEKDLARRLEALHNREAEIMKNGLKVRQSVRLANPSMLAETVGAGMDEETGRMKIEDLNLSNRSTNALLRYGITDFDLLVSVAQKGALNGIKSMGEKSVSEVLDVIKKYTGYDYYNVEMSEEPENIVAGVLEKRKKAEQK